MKKVVVLGCPGAGKSVFAAKLRRRAGLPLIHLDNLWWRADRTHVSRAEFDQALASVLHTEAWILDGDFSRTYEVRVRACDDVVFLDYDEAVCMAGIKARAGQTRPDIPWTEEAPDPLLIEAVRRYRAEKRPIILNLLEQYPEKEQYLFRSRKQAEQWLETLPPGQNSPCFGSSAAKTSSPNGIDIKETLQ